MFLASAVQLISYLFFFWLSIAVETIVNEVSFTRIHGLPIVRSVAKLLAARNAEVAGRFSQCHVCARRDVHASFCALSYVAHGRLSADFACWWRSTRVSLVNYHRNKSNRFLLSLTRFLPLKDSS